MLILKKNSWMANFFSEEYDTEQAAAWMRSQSSGLEELMKTRSW